nr:transposase (putative), gypsy type [Tanacetum cinerariifolium]
MSEYVCVNVSFGNHTLWDHFPNSTEFNADGYDILVACPDPFRKFPEPFLCLIGMSRNYTLHEDTYPTFLHDDRTEMDLFAFIQVTDPTKVKVRERERAEGEARLLDSTVGRVVPLLLVAPARAESELEASVEKLFDEGGSAHQVDFAASGGQEAEVGIATGVRIVAEENMAGDYEASSEAVICGKSPSALGELLASSLLNVEVDVTALQTLPMVTSSVSATPELKSGAHADSVTGPNVRTVGASEKFVISSDSFHHSTTHAFEAEGDSFIRSDVIPSVMTEAVVTSHAIDIPPDQEMGIKVTSLVRASLFQDSDSTETVKADTAGPSYSAKQDLFMGSRELNSETLRQETEAAEAVHLRARVSASEITKKKRASKDGLVSQVHELEVTCSGLRERLSEYENLTDQLEEFQDAQLKVVNDKVAKLDADLAGMACHLEEKFYPHLLTTISGRRWLLTHGLKLVLVKCLYSSEYLMALGAAISRSIEKGMQDGLAAGIDHGRKGRNLKNVAVYNPSAEADFNSALHELRPLADAPGMGDLQPDIEQLKVPIHISEDQVVLGETSLSFALSVSHSRVEQIRANIAAERSALLDIWNPLSEPMSVHNLIGESNTSASVPAAIVTTTTLSTSFASASSIPHIIVYDYEIVHADGQESPQGNVQGDAATVEFENEDLDTTSERDLLS